MLTNLIAGSGLLGSCLDMIRDMQDVNQRRIAVREQLWREAGFNADVLKLLSGTRITPEQRLRALQFEVTAAVLKLPLPMEEFLAPQLSKDATALLVASPPGRDGRYQHWVAGIMSEQDLLERVWLRYAIADVRIRAGVGRADLDYLRLLIRALATTLRPEAGSKAASC